MSEAHTFINTRLQADAVAERDLARCAAEVLDWRRTGLLDDDALVRQVAAVWERAGEIAPEQQAENTVILLALRRAAGVPNRNLEREGSIQTRGSSEEIGSNL